MCYLSSPSGTMCVVNKWGRSPEACLLLVTLATTIQGLRWMKWVTDLCYLDPTHHHLSMPFGNYTSSEAWVLSYVVQSSYVGQLLTFWNAQCTMCIPKCALNYFLPFNTIVCRYSLLKSVDMHLYIVEPKWSPSHINMGTNIDSERELKTMSINVIHWNEKHWTLGVMHPHCDDAPKTNKK
jgi:hypothetical protein